MKDMLLLRIERSFALHAIIDAVVIPCVALLLRTERSLLLYAIIDDCIHHSIDCQCFPMGWATPKNYHSHGDLDTIQ